MAEGNRAAEIADMIRAIGSRNLTKQKLLKLLRDLDKEAE